MSRQLMSDGGTWVNEGMVSYTVYPVGSHPIQQRKIELPKAMRDDLQKYEEYMFNKYTDKDNKNSRTKFCKICGTKISQMYCPDCKKD